MLVVLVVLDLQAAQLVLMNLLINTVNYLKAGNQFPSTGPVNILSEESDAVLVGYPTPWPIPFAL